jgi:SHS2 domain-containing protein
MMSTYKYFNHTADLGIEVYGKNLEELFINIGRAIFETQISGKIALKKEIKIEFESESIEDLFIDWCRELIYNFSVHGFIPEKYKISIDNLSLKAHLSGDIFNNKKHKIKTEIKNPTYHNFQLKKTSKYYKATIIFDI